MREGALDQTKADRSRSYRALEALEVALDAPAPGRETEWVETVIHALDALYGALVEQSQHNRHPESLLSQIAKEQPRFGYWITQLENEHDELIAAEKSLRDQLTSATASELDRATTRQRLVDLDARFRLLRAREVDIVYEAFNLDIGGKG